MQNTPQNQPQPMSEDTKTIITVIVLLGFYPVGIILMWIWTHWAAWIKWLITIVGCLPFIVLGMVIVFSILYGTSQDPAFRNNSGGMYESGSDLRIDLEGDTLEN